MAVKECQILGFSWPTGSSGIEAYRSPRRLNPSLSVRKDTRKDKASWWWVVPSGVLEPDDQRGQGFTGIRLQTGSLQPNNIPRVFNPLRTVKGRLWKETHSLNVMADDETGIRLFSATEKYNTISIPRIKMQFLIFYSKEKKRLGQWAGFYIPVPM